MALAVRELPIRLSEGGGDWFLTRKPRFPGVSTSGASRNTVYLGGDDRDSVVGCEGWLWPVAVFGAFDVPAGHFAFDAAWVGA
jgi:hypothetical protein